MRREARAPGLAFKHVFDERLLVVLRRDSRLAARSAIRARDLVGEVFIEPTKAAPSLKVVIDAYAAKMRVALKASHEAENLAMAMSLVASTGGVTLLPEYALQFLPAGIVSRPLAGEAPTIELVIGYSKANATPVLKRFLSNLDAMVQRVARRGS
jgi:LysR family transcriptional regulator, hca operon transcriptional activator